MNAKEVIGTITEADIDEFRALKEKDPTIMQMIVSIHNQLDEADSPEHVADCILSLCIGFWYLGKSA